MSELTMDRLRKKLEALKMKNTLEILDNYLERAVAENLNIVEVLAHIFSEEANSKRKRAYEKQIQMSGFPIKNTLNDFDFSFQPSIDKSQITVRMWFSSARQGWARPIWHQPQPRGGPASLLYLLHQLPPVY